MTSQGRAGSASLDGKQQAHPVSSTGQALVAIACSSPPEGHVSWTLHLLADKVVELEFAGSISLETVRQILKKNELKPWKKKEWCIPKVSGEFVARMEDVVDPVSSTGQALLSRRVRPGASGGVFRRDLQAVARGREAARQSQARTGGAL